MLIIHGTAVFRAKVAGPPAEGSTSTTELGAWYGNVVRRRRPLALLVNERTLLPVLMPLAPARTLVSRFPEEAAEVLGALETPAPFIEREVRAMREVRIAPTADRSVLGVLNQMNRMLDRWLIEQDTDLLDLSLWLAQMPTSKLQHRAPDLELRDVVGRLQPQTTAGGPFPGFPTSIRTPDGRTIAVEHRPGLAAGLLDDLKPLLAADGIDLDDPDAPPDLETLRAGLDRAMERHNMALFTPVGRRRSAAVALLQEVATAVVDGDDPFDVLGRARPESRDERVPEVSAVIGVALGFIDEWLSGRDPEAPRDLGAGLAVPKQWRKAARPAAEIIALGTRDRAAESLGALIARQGGEQVLAGAALAVALAAIAWADRTGTPLDALLSRILR